MSGRVAKPPECRVLGADDYAALKNATRLAFKDAGGPEQFFEETRAGSAETLRNYVKHERPAFAPVDVIADAERHARRPFVTEALARIAGFRLMPVAASVTGRGVMFDALREACEFGAQASEDLRDGKVDRLEAPEFLKALREAQRAFAAAEAQLLADHPFLKGEAE